MESPNGRVEVQTPEYSERGGTHYLNFPFHGVKVQVSRVRESSSSLSAQAEFYITAQLDNAASFKIPFAMNMLSSQTRGKQANDIHQSSKVLSAPIWRQIIEHSCGIVLQRHRAGEPAIHMSDYEPPSYEPAFRLWPFLEDQEATVLFGDGESGKSMLAIFMGYLVATGTHSAGMRPMRGNVLYLDYETSKDTMARRLKAIAEGFGEGKPEYFIYRRMVGPLATDLHAINNIVEKNSVDLVIVDSAAPAVGEPESAAPTNEYFVALRSLNCTTLTLAHVSKEGREQHPFGSIFWRNLPRSLFRARPRQSTTQLLVGLRHHKNNNGPRLDDLAYSFNFEPGMTRVDKADPGEIDEMLDSAPLKTRIYRLLLSEGEMTVKAIAEEMGASVGVTRSTLNRLKDEGGEIIKVGKTTWGVKA